MFPEFLEFDGTRHRTQKINSAIMLIYQNNSKLQSKKNETNLSFLDLSQEVIPLGCELRSIFSVLSLSGRFLKSDSPNHSPFYLYVLTANAMTRI